MIQNIENYLKSLFSANVSVSGLEDALKLIKASSELKAVLNDPNVPAADKAKVAEELFVPSVKDFILQLSKQGNIDDLEEIINNYISEINKENNVVSAKVFVLTPRMISSLRVSKNLFARKQAQKKPMLKLLKMKILSAAL